MRDKTVRDVLIQELREGAQVGICADLCPEKEIYRRWTQQDISVLEMNEHGQIAIEKCIKVYQRSAADTEESLPNELRPASTLLDCCWYFCSEVCTEDVIEEIGADVWYDFMWKRTRAIRKDITQQHMSCLKTAQVLETVARYHIWCSHSMVLEDFWDQRINDENLEKTLTSIEHVYQDISVRGQYSAAEPEFRAYMIYLNLNDSGAVMKYLSRVPKRFKTHPLVKRARRIVSAYMLRHYAIFWNEFSKCTALEASILHRYMGNVRYHAMQILRRGYANNVLPMECFQKALFFKANDPNFETYMAAHNVFPNDDGQVSIVEMAKSFVAEPEVPLPKWKSKYIMEDLSANKTPGQLIWGINSHLKPWSSKNYKPSSSFLPRSDRLIESANDIIENVRAKLEEDAQNRNDTMENLPENIAAREMQEEITNDVVDGQLREIASGVRIEEKVVAKQINDTMNLLIDNHIGWEVTRIYKNMLLQERLREEELKNQIAEEKERIRQLKKEWKEQFLERCVSNMVDNAIGNFISSFVEENVDEAIATRNRTIRENTALIERQNILEEVVAEDVKVMLLEEIATVRRVHREKVAAVRQRRRDRISKQAALWWLRRARIAISKRKARAATPRIGKRNILKEISQQNEEFMKMTIDRARRNCKKEVRQSNLYSIVYPDLDVSKFYLEHLVENINPRLNNFVASFLFYTDDKNVFNYLEKKFPSSGILGTRSKFIYLELAPSEPQEGLVFDEEVYFGTSSKADIVVDFRHEEETNRNIESHLTDILLSTKPKNFTRMPFVKLLERVIVDTDSGLRCMDGLVKGYSHVRINQKPDVVLAWYNNLIEQMIRRMSMDGLDLHYPERLVETGLVFGPTISSRHISILKELKLQPINLDGGANKWDTESCLNIVWKYLEENKLFTTTLQVQLSRVLNRKFNDDNQEEGFEKEKIFPWSDVISKIVESKLTRLHFLREGREIVTVDDRLFRKYQTLPLVRKELKRIERKSPKMPKKYGFHKPRELEAAAPPAVEKTISKNSIQSSTNSADLFAKSDTERMDTSAEELKTAVTIEALFKGVESKFEDEISRSKQTLVDAKGTIATLKKDFERFQEMETLRAMVQSKPRPKDLTFMEHEKKILQAELDTKLTEIELMVAISKKHRDKIKEEYENMEPEEVNFDPSDMIDLEESDNEPIDFEPSDMSDVFSKGPTDMIEDMSASDAAQSNDGPFAGDSRDSFKPSRNKTAGMAVSDDECSAAPGRIYDNPLTSGPKKRLDDDESRMALSESESDSERDNRNNAGQNEPGPSSQVDDDEQDIWPEFASQKNDDLLSPRKEWVYAPVLAPDSQEQPHPDIPKPWDPEMTQGSQGSILSESVIPETQSTRAETPTQSVVSNPQSQEVQGSQGPQLLPHEVRDLLGIISSQSTNDDEEESSQDQQLDDSTITVDPDNNLQNVCVPDSQESSQEIEEEAPDPMDFWDDEEEEPQVVDEQEVFVVDDSTNNSQEASSQIKSSLDNSQCSQEENVYVISSQESQDSVQFVPETQSPVNGNEVYVIPETQDQIEDNVDMYDDQPEGESDDSGDDWNLYNINAQNIHHWESWNRQGRYEGTNMTYPEWLERGEQNERMMALDEENEGQHFEMEDEDDMPIGQLYDQRYQQHGLGGFMNDHVSDEESSEADEEEEERWRIEARNRRQQRRAAAPPPDNDEVICLDSD